MSVPELDQRRSFHLDDGRVRGQLVRLDSSLAEVLSHHHYPAAVAGLIGEALAAAVLMGATLKFSGALSLQARSSGPVALLFAECREQWLVRGFARVQAGSADGDLGQLLRGGTLAITISPERGERYQGIVPLDAGSLAPCLEHYFLQSEQLPTVLRLACDGRRAAGLLLQALPARPSAPAPVGRWEHLSTLAGTTRPGELLSDPFETLLYHLFHQERVRLHDGEAVRFGCSCSAARAADTLRALGEPEARDVLRERGLVQIHCEFCQQEYRFDSAAIDQLFREGLAGSRTVH